MWDLRAPPRNLTRLVGSNPLLKASIYAMGQGPRETTEICFSRLRQLTAFQDLVGGRGMENVSDWRVITRECYSADSEG